MSNIQPGKHEWMVTSWMIGKNSREAQEIMCKHCLMMLDNHDMITLRSRKKRVEIKTEDE